MQDRTKEVAVRKVVVSEFVSLDGMMEDPSWESPLRGEEQVKFKFDELVAADALLLGRTTYEGFGAAWPDMMEHYEGPRREALGEYTDMMNGYAEVGGLNMYYERNGDGPPLVLLHGTFGTIESWLAGLLPEVARYGRQDPHDNGPERIPDRRASGQASGRLDERIRAP
jgi:hypothetical protein